MIRPDLTPKEYIIFVLVIMFFIPVIISTFIAALYIFKNRYRELDGKEISNKVKFVQLIELPSAIVAFIIALLLGLNIWISLLVLLSGIVLIFVHGIYLYYKIKGVNSKLSALRDDAALKNNH